MNKSDTSANTSKADRAALFSALGDPTRLAIIERLHGGEPRSIAQLSGGLNLTRQGVTKHLRVLERAGIVSSQRQGRENQFRCRPESLDRAKAYLETVAQQWDVALDRLKYLVEN